MDFACMLFFFSSRRRHTRSKRDWSSDVCSSDLDRLRFHKLLPGKPAPSPSAPSASASARNQAPPTAYVFSSRSEERREGKSVDVGGRRTMKKKNKKTQKASSDTKQITHDVDSKE